MKRNLMLVLLAALLVVGLAGVSASVARADGTVYTEGTLYYTIANESITITGCFGRDAEVHVPAMIAGIPVNTIAAGAFASNENVKTVYLPDTISKVEPGAFGAWVHVIYNANTDHPQDTPTDLILGLLTPAVSDSTEPTELPTETTQPPADPTQPPAPPVEGSGTEEDTEPDPTATPKPAATQKPSGTQATTVNVTATPDPGDEVPGTAFGEDDVDDDEDSKEAATPEPTEAPTPEPTEEPTPEPTEAPVTEAPKATEAPKVVETKTTDAPAKTEPVATAEPAPAEQDKGNGWIWGVGGAAVVIAGAAVLLKKRKKA